jgi:hypothetical protein
MIASSSFSSNVSLNEILAGSLSTPSSNDENVLLKTSTGLMVFEILPSSSEGETPQPPPKRL